MASIAHRKRREPSRCVRSGTNPLEHGFLSVQALGARNLNYDLSTAEFRCKRIRPELHRMHRSEARRKS
jgi:hypothetical protein